MSSGSFRLLDLPVEIRTHILTFLLPNLPSIECDLDWSPLNNNAPRRTSPSTWYVEDDAVFDFRDDGGPCYPQILCVNRQLYWEGTDYLYKQKTYKINVFEFGIDFLKESTQLCCLPPLPYHRMKEFVIQVRASNPLEETGCRLRDNLLWLCGLLHHNNVRLNKLKIVFSPSPYAWAEAWDETEPRELPEEVRYNDGFLQENHERIARDWGFASTFAWILSPVALLPVVGECTIEVPEPLRQKSHIVKLAKWYEKGIDGRYTFDGEAWPLKDDREEFHFVFTDPKAARKNY
ncbi:MAG: hypothetical protein Q9201_000838 [Fulgogasparrea decipioides]